MKFPPFQPAEEYKVRVDNVSGAIRSFYPAYQAQLSKKIVTPCQSAGKYWSRRKGKSKCEQSDFGYGRLTL
jgi:hypothetical protein